MSDLTPLPEPPVPGSPPAIPEPPAQPAPASSAWSTPHQAPDFVGEPSTRKRRAGAIIGVALAVAFVLVAGSVAVALYALRGSPDSLGRMIPNSTDFSLSVNLDPGLGQKANLSRLASKFPSLHGGKLRKNVNDELDAMLRDVAPGVSFQRDVQPWLGSQVAVIGRITSRGDVAALIASKDDAAAEAALGRASAGTGGSWTTSRHGGATVHVRSGGSDGPGAYAVLDHAAVLGSTKAIVEDVIDADQGTTPRMVDSASYTQAVASLPEARLALVFVNYPHLVQELKGSGLDPDLFGSFSGDVSLDAYRGLGVALSAESGGVALDVSIPLDPSKLSADDVARLNGHGDAGPLLAWVPARAFATLALPNLPAKSFLQALAESPDLTPGLARQLRGLGITGPGGLEEHFTGAFVVEGGSGANGPAGAILVGTDDEAAMQRTLDRVAKRLAPKMLGGSSTVVTSKGALKVIRTTPPLHWSTVTHDDVTIRYVSGPGPSPGLQPAYAVSNGMGILATSPEEIQAVLDTKAGGPSVSTAPNFVAALSHGGSTQGDVIYVDIESLVGTLVPEGQVPGDARPLRSVIVTDHQSQNLISERLFLSIK